MKIFLIAFYLILFALVIVLQDKGLAILSARSYLFLGLIFASFFGAGVLMAYLRRNEKKGQYDFPRRFFLAAAYSGLVISVVQIFMGEYGSTLGISTVCIALLLGMQMKFRPDV